MQSRVGSWKNINNILWRCPVIRLGCVRSNGRELELIDQILGNQISIKLRPQKEWKTYSLGSQRSRRVWRVCWESSWLAEWHSRWILNRILSSPPRAKRKEEKMYKTKQWDRSPYLLNRIFVTIWVLLYNFVHIGFQILGGCLDQMVDPCNWSRCSPVDVL